MAFGGAGPLFCDPAGAPARDHPHCRAAPCRQLLRLRPARRRSRSERRPDLDPRVADGALADGNEILGQLFATLEERTDRRPQRTHANTVHEVALDMRYVGQEHTITVDVPCGPGGTVTLSPSDLLGRFTAQYEKTYGERVGGADRGDHLAGHAQNQALPGAARARCRPPPSRPPRGAADTARLLVHRAIGPRLSDRGSLVAGGFSLPSTARQS